MSQQHTAHLNNIGIVFMGNGDLQEAFVCFQEAMENTMQLLATTTVPEKIQATKKTLDTGDGVTLWNNHSSIAEMIERHRMGLPEKHDTFSLLYATPFHIDGQSGAYSHDCFLNTTIISAMVLFNLGILYQHQGVDHLGAARGLIKACTLHEMCRLLLCDAGVCLTPTSNPVVDVLSMAVTNNLAQISCDLSRFDASRCYQYLLVEFAASIEPRSYATASTATLVESEKKRFLLIASVRFIPEVAPAA